MRKPTLTVRRLGAALGPSATSGTVLVANQQSASATIIDLATRAETTLDVGIGPHEAAISPDGRWGVFRLEDQGQFGLFRMRPDGTHLRAILPLSDFAPRFIDWGPRPDRDGRNAGDDD